MTVKWNEVKRNREISINVNYNFDKWLQHNSNPQLVLMKSLNLELEWHNLTLPVPVSDEDRK